MNCCKLKVTAYISRGTPFHWGFPSSSRLTNQNGEADPAWRRIVYGDSIKTTNMAML